MSGHISMPKRYSKYKKNLTITVRFFTLSRLWKTHTRAMSIFQALFGKEGGAVRRRVFGYAFPLMGKGDHRTVVDEVNCVQLIISSILLRRQPPLGKGAMRASTARPYTVLTGNYPVGACIARPPTQNPTFLSPTPPVPLSSALRRAGHGALHYRCRNTRPHTKDRPRQADGAGCVL